MDELPPHVKAYIRNLRHTSDPPAGAQERVRERIRFIEHGAANADHAVKPRFHRISALQTRMLLVAGSMATIIGVSVWLESRRAEPVPLPQKPPIESAPRSPSSIQPEVPPPAVADAAVDSHLQQHPQRGRRPELGSTDANRLVDELRMLSAASQSLQNANLARARKQLDNYRHRFPDGQLRSERDGLEVLYGCLTGASGSAARARAYTDKVPGGLLVSRIKTACELSEPR